MSSSRTDLPLHVEVLEGAGPPVVFLPGLGATTRYWKGRVDGLRDRATLILVDLLGFGQSPKPWVRYSVDRHVDSLESILQRRGPAVVVGHSLGATLALALAARHPRLVPALVLMSLPVFGAEEETILGFRKGPSPGGWIARNMVLTAVTCVFMRRVMGRLLPLVVRDMPRDVVEDLVRHTWRSSTSSLWEVVYRHDVSRDADEIPSRTPVHLLHGDRDPTAPPEAVNRLAGVHLDWELQMVSGIGHHPLLEAPEVCLGFIERCLDSVPGGRTA